MQGDACRHSSELTFLLNPPAPNKVENGHHYCNDNQKVDQAARDVKGQTTDPEQQEKNRDN